MYGCITRHRATKAIQKAESNKYDIEILQDHELETLYTNTTFSNTYQNQRYNQMILLRGTGMGPGTMQRLDVCAWHRLEVDGVLHLKPHFRTMGGRFWAARR